MCVNFPTGVSPRVASQNGDSCTDFDYCFDGDFISESCTPGQYFDAEISKSLIQIQTTIQFVVVLPIDCYFKVVVFQLMIYHVVLHVQIPAQSTHGALVAQKV